MDFPWAARHWEALRGQHLVVERDGYTHHGVAIDNWCVVEYGGASGKKGAVQKVGIDQFRAGRHLMVRQYNIARNSWQDTEKLAYSRLGENKYNLFANNCEHFATWCVTGNPRSHQVKRYGITIANTFILVVSLPLVIIPRVAVTGLIAPLTFRSLKVNEDFADIDVCDWLLANTLAF